MQNVEIGWFGDQRSTKVTENVTIRQRTQTSYSTLIETVSILYRFQVITNYLSKVANFNLPHLHLAPRLGLTPFEFRRDLWQQKTRVPGLATDRQTDGRTDRQTDDDG